MRDLKAWTRIGDQDDYRDHDTPYDAGICVGDRLAAGGASECPVIRYHVGWGGGVDIEPFIGDNYISLYWGDNDAQFEDVFCGSDRLDFEAGIEEGLNS